MKVVLAALNAKYIHSSLALKYLEQSARKVCPGIVRKEYTINNGLLDILGDIYSEKPDVVGLACYIWNIEMTLQLGQLIKKVQPNVRIVLGGPEVSYESADFLRKNPFVDFIVLGEGEETMPALLAALSAGKNGKNIRGLTYRDRDGIREGVPQVVDKLDQIPFPYYDGDMEELKDKIIYYESSRGCPFSCQYCLSSATAGVRFLSLERVFADLRFFIRHNVRQVKFVDRTFNARKEHYWPIIQFLAAQECRTNFHFEIAADILDEEVLQFLHRVPAGRIQFEIGVQSTHEPTLKQIQRSNEWEKLTASVKRIVANGNMHVHLDLIVGLPLETCERFAQSFNDVYALQPHMLQIGFLKLLRGSGIRICAKQHDYVYMDTAPYEVLANRYMSYEEIRRLKIMEELFNQIYNSGRFRYLLPFFIERHENNAFLFYRKLTAFWEQTNRHLVAHSTKAIYQYLTDFYRETQRDGEDEFLELLKFNALMSENGTVRPDFLPWNDEQWSEEKNAFWRNELLLQKYLPEFRFTNWREVKKRYHLEVFSAQSLKNLTVGQAQAEYVPVLFSYCDGKTSWQRIDAADFWPVGN
jgi:radical SAM superfamily enzyme YgiQ (UPF0313 family)